MPLVRVPNVPSLLTAAELEALDLWAHVGPLYIRVESVEVLGEWLLRVDVWKARTLGVLHGHVGTVWRKA